MSAQQLIPQEILRDFITAKQADGVSPRTTESYSYHLKRYIASQKPATLEDVAPSSLRTYLLEMRNSGLSAHTVHGAARSLRCFCRWMEAEGIRKSPWQNIKMPVFPKEIQPAFSADDVRLILAACDSQRDKALVMTALDTGLRLAELAALKRSDIDLQSGAVFVRKGKGDKPRTVYAGAKTRQAIARYTRTATDDTLWRTEEGDALSPSGIAQVFKRIGKRAGVKPCSAHRFRRSFAIASLRAGMDIFSLQRLMGHADLTVLKQYLDLVTSDLQRAHDAHGALAHMLK